MSWPDVWRTEMTVEDDEERDSLNMIERENLNCQINVSAVE